MQGFLTILWYIAVFFIGAVFGMLFFVIFRKVVAQGLTREYFKNLKENLLELLKMEERFWPSYKNILIDSFRYAGLQFLGIFLALLPLGLLILLIKIVTGTFFLLVPATIFEISFYLGFGLTSLLLFVLESKNTQPQKEDSYLIGAVDMILTSLVRYHPDLWRKIGGFEDKCYASRLKKITIEKPIYITGLARCGSTIVLELLASIEGIASHRYRDFPFLMTPIFWNQFVSMFSKQQEPKERPHQDRILINRESPDAFEEPLWQYFFPQVHASDQRHLLERNDQNASFDQFYTTHIKKILYIRKGCRYVSKGNYNITRLEYLNQLYPDAYFVIPIRHPITHIHSLVRQHEKFLKYAKKNPRVGEYLEAAGHYEFGPQRKPVSITAEGTKRTLEAWDGGNDALGYAIQWADIYGHVQKSYLSDPELTQRIFVLRYEDFCENPAQIMKKLLTFLDLDDTKIIDEASKTISAPSYQQTLSSDQARLCWDEVEKTATLFNYERI